MTKKTNLFIKKLEKKFNIKKVNKYKYYIKKNKKIIGTILIEGSNYIYITFDFMGYYYKYYNVNDSNDKENCINYIKENI